MSTTSPWVRDCTDADRSTGTLGMVKPGSEAELTGLDEELPPSPRATGAAAVLAVLLALVGAAALAIASPSINESLTDTPFPGPPPAVHQGSAPQVAVPVAPGP